jgi:hypothetical protein
MPCFSSPQNALPPFGADPLLNTAPLPSIGDKVRDTNGKERQHVIFSRIVISDGTRRNNKYD